MKNKRRASRTAVATITILLVLISRASSSMSVGMTTMSGSSGLARIGDDNLVLEFMMDSHPTTRMLAVNAGNRPLDKSKPVYGCGPNNRYCVAPKHPKPKPRCSKYLRDQSKC